jgi:hypothetical protein
MKNVYSRIDRALVIAALALALIGGLGGVYAKQHNPEIFRTKLWNHAPACVSGTLYNSQYPNGTRHVQCDYTGEEARLVSISRWSIFLITWMPLAAAFFSSTMLYNYGPDGKVAGRKKNELNFLAYAWAVFVIVGLPIGIDLFVLN